MNQGMIWSRTPCRISFLGGGTDLPAYYEHEKGSVLSATIDQFVYVGVKSSYDPFHRFRYEGLELVKDVSGFTNPIVRAVLGRYDGFRRDRDPSRGWDILSTSDVPPGTGLGSSSTFTVGLLNAVRSYLGFQSDPVELAKEAVDIEMNELESAAGKQDQFCAALGGLLFLDFFPSGEVTAAPVAIPPGTFKELCENSILLYSGITRSATTVLKRRRDSTAAKRESLRQMGAMARELRSLFEQGAPMSEVGRIMHQGWELKKRFADGITLPEIDDWYARALKAGAWGGKLLGAGGGGYLFFICPPDRRQNVVSELKGLTDIKFEFEPFGSSIRRW